MPEELWDEASGRRRRWPLVAGLAAAVLAGSLLARQPSTPEDATLHVEEVVTEATAQPPASPTRPTTAAGEWVRLADPPLDAPPVHLGVWTGRELLVGFHPDVAAHDPVTDTWRQLPAVPGPERVEPQLVWTGEDVLLFGGLTTDGSEAQHPDGLALDPDTWRWRTIPAAPAAPSWDPTAVWSGEELLVWGGARPGDAAELRAWPVRGSAWNRGQGRWRELPPAPVENVYFSEGMWTGREAVFWGTHHPPGQQLDDEPGPAFAAAYDPAADAWRRLPAPPLEEVVDAAVVWTGSGLLLWGRLLARGPDDEPGVGGAVLDLAEVERGWQLLPAMRVDGRPQNVYGLVAAWTGRKALIYGGYPQSVGLVYDVEAESWQHLPAHRARVNAVAAWTGTELLLWGGYTTSGPAVDLWAFRPPAPAHGCLPEDNLPPAAPAPEGWSWSPAALPGVVPAVAVWTGEQLLAWDGRRPHNGTGDRGVALDPVTSQRLCLPPAPLAARDGAGSTWTDTALFVWGGVPARGDGALYDPAGRSWRLLPAAPLEAGLPLAVVWTGREVLVWGSARSRGAAAGEGAAYDPATDTWRRLPLAPLSLNSAEGVWTGRELLVLGAQLGAGNVATTPHAVGLAYEPAGDTWRRLPDHPLSPQASSIAWTGRFLLAWDYELAAAAYHPDTDTWIPLPDLPLTPAECRPRSAVSAGQVFAWYCGQAAVLDTEARRWRRVDVPPTGAEVVPLGVGDAVVLVGQARTWRYDLAR